MHYFQASAKEFESTNSSTKLVKEALRSEAFFIEMFEMVANKLGAKASLLLKAYATPSHK